MNYIYIMSIYAIESLSDIHSVLIYMPCCMYSMYMMKIMYELLHTE